MEGLSEMDKKLTGKIGTIARFKPVHLGHAALLEAVCEQADEVLIGLGSINVYDLRNPFTAKESQEMIEALLKTRFSNYKFIEVPDFNNGPKWAVEIKNLFGELDYFVTANDYVRELLKDIYTVIRPIEIVHYRN